MYESSVTPIGYDEIDKIDAHMHLNCERLALTEIAEKEGFRLITINTDVSFFPDLQEQKKIALNAMTQSNNRLTFVTSFESIGIGSARWAEKAIAQIQNGMEHGAVAVKIWKNFGMELRDSENNIIMADNPALDPVYKYLEKNEIPLLAHLGEPKNCWLPLEQMTVLSDRSYFSNHPQFHMYKNRNWPSYEEQLLVRDRILQKFPGLQFVGAHLASLEWSVEKLAKWLDEYPRCGVDLAERVCHLQHQASENSQRVRDFIVRYQDRLIYGSDHIDNGSLTSEETQNEIREKWRNEFRFFSENEIQRSSIVEKPFKGLGLRRKILKKIFHENAIHYYSKLDSLISN